MKLFKRIKQMRLIYVSIPFYRVQNIKMRGKHGFAPQGLIADKRGKALGRNPDMLGEQALKLARADMGIPRQLTGTKIAMRMEHGPNRVHQRIVRAAKAQSARQTGLGLGDALREIPRAGQTWGEGAYQRREMPFRVTAGVFGIPQAFFRKESRAPGKKRTPNVKHPGMLAGA